LESYCQATEALAATHAELIVGLVQFWPGGFVCLVGDMLFVAVVEGRLLKVVVNEFG
jgi:hypothetical protein